MNICFEYLYRDAGNFKNWGDVVFSNIENHEPAKLEELARKILIDEEFFVAKKAEVPDLRFPEIIDELDHGWHEFYSFSETSDEPNDPQGRDIMEFLSDLDVASQERHILKVNH